MSRYGRGRVERRLYEMRALGISELDEAVATFVWQWREARAIRFAERWLLQRPAMPVYSKLILRLFSRPWRALPLYLAELARPDLPDQERDAVIEHLFGILHRLKSHPRYQEAWQTIAVHLDHPSPEVRWTTVFCLAYERSYREELERAATDETLSRYGYVSRIAKNALSTQDGRYVDLFYGSVAEANANGTAVLM